MPTSSQFRCDGYRLDLGNGQLWCAGQAVPLTARALGVLVRHTGALVRKATLVQTVWSEATVSEPALANCITPACGLDRPRRLGEGRASGVSSCRTSGRPV